MKKKIAIEMTETWWDAVLMAIVDALDTREVHSVEACEVYTALRRAKFRLQKRLDEETL